MKLTELDPQWNNGRDGTKYLDFLCPALHKVWPDDDESTMRCRIVIPVTNPGSWQVDSEDFETLSLTPSVWHHCKEDPHFFITKGEIINA